MMPSKRRPRVYCIETLELRAVFAAGELDPGFGTGGIVRTEFSESQTYGTAALAVSIQSDGKVIAAGAGGLARFNADGSIDSSFGSEGRVAVPLYARALAVQADGKLLVAGGTAEYNSADMVVVRYLANGTLDTSWDGDGVANIDFSGPNEWATSLMMEPSGRIVVAGGASGSVAVARLLSDGQLDATFDADGKQVRQFTRSDTAFGLARQSNGRILVVGTSWVDFAYNSSNFDMFVLRLNTNGSVDASFDGDGIAHANFTSSAFSRDQGRGIAVQPDGRIVITGSVYGNFTEYAGVARFNTDGSLDPDFGVEGRVRLFLNLEVAVGGVIVLSDGQLLVSNYRSLVRLSSTGVVDTTYGVAGSALLNGFGYALAQDSDGKVLVGGSYNGVFGVKRFLSDGVVDASFSVDGLAIAAMGSSQDTATHSVLQTDGKIIVVGSSQLGFGVARYLSNGQLDSSFSGDGLAVINFGDQVTDAIANAVALQADGKIVIAGTIREANNPTSYSRMAVARLDADGMLDPSFSGDGLQIVELTGYSEANTVVIQPDGKIVLGGVYNDSATLVRYTSDGSLDSSFSNDGIVSMATGGSVISSMVLQPDGRILAAGNVRPSSFVTTTYAAVLMVARFRANGSLDPSFGVNGKMVDQNRQRTADDIVLLPDGSFIVTGDTSRYFQYSETSNMAVSQYDSAGNVTGPLGWQTYSETEANTLSDFYRYPVNSWANAIFRQADGKLVVVGYTSTQMIIRRVNPDGTSDSSFAGDGVMQIGLPQETWRATNIVQQSDGQLVVTGYARGPSVAGLENDFIVARLQNQAVPSYSTNVAVNAQGNIEISDLWGRDDRLEFSRVGDSIVVRENSYDTHSSFRVVNLPGISGNGTREIVIPVSVIQATGKPLIVNTMAGDDSLIIDNDSFEAPPTGMLYRAGSGDDKLSMSNHQIPIPWVMSAATSGSARPMGRVPINFTSVENLEGGQANDSFRLVYSGNGEMLKINGGGGMQNSIELRADANLSFTTQVLAGYGQRILVDNGSGRTQIYAMTSINLATLRGGAGNNRIDASAFLGKAVIYGGDGDDELYAPYAYNSFIYGGAGNDLIFGNTGNDQLWGGVGDDLVSGWGGDDMMYGDDGADVLIGGSGADWMYGGAKDDLLLGGDVYFMTWNKDAAAFAQRDAVLSTWRSNDSYETKIDKLLNVGVGDNNSVRLQHNSTVYDDGTEDTFFGNSGRDWFFVDYATERGGSGSVGLRDRASDEELVYI